MRWRRIAPFSTHSVRLSAGMWLHAHPLTLWTWAVHSTVEFRSPERGQWRCLALQRNADSDTSIYNFVSKARWSRARFQCWASSNRTSVKTTPTRREFACRHLWLVLQQCYKNVASFFSCCFVFSLQLSFLALFKHEDLLFTSASG